MGQDGSGNAPMHPERSGGAVETVEVLVTAGEAYPAFEREFLAAKSEISGSFRVFDLDTKLRSHEAKKIGKTWGNLVVHTLDRGVRIRLTVTDFDPVGANAMHRMAWRTDEHLAKLRERTKNPSLLDFRVAMHDAKAGLCPMAVFYPMVRRKMKEIAEEWRGLSDKAREAFWRRSPGLHKICRRNGDRLIFRAGLYPLTPATHHQKLAVFDRKRAYVGGLDLDERRFDTKDHDQPAQETWHDVQALITGPAAEAAQAHLDQFLDQVAGRTEPRGGQAGFLRTLSGARGHSAPFRLAPKTRLSEPLDRHKQDLRRANRLIYLETQFLRYRPLARALARRARACAGLRLIVVLPAAPEDVAFSSDFGLDARFGEHLQARCISHLRRGFGPDRLIVASPVQPRPAATENDDKRDTLRHAPIIYVHSKVSVFDDFSGILSSANLNGRSLRWDTEAAVHLTDPAHVDLLRRTVMGHWLPEDAGEEFFDLDTGFDAWKKLIDFNSVSAPNARRGFLVNYDADAARDAAQAIPAVPEEIV